MKKHPDFSIDPQFPRHAFIVFTFVGENGIFHEEFDIYNQVFFSEIEAADTLFLVINGVRYEYGMGKGAELKSYIIPMEFHYHIPLTAAMYNKNTQPYTHEIQNSFFKPVFATPRNYSVLVTPLTVTGDGNNFYNPIFPAENTADKEIFNKFLLTTNTTVDTDAKYAAVYKLGDKKFFDWEAIMDKPGKDTGSNIN